MTSPLRIVHAVRSDSFAGVERSIVLSSRALVERGHHVAVIGGDPAAMAGPLDALGDAHRPARTTTALVRALWRVGRVDVVHAHMTAAEAAALATRPRNRGRLVCSRHFATRRAPSGPGRVPGWFIERLPRRELAISRFVAASIGVESVVVPHGLPDRQRIDADSAARRIAVVQRLETEKCTALALEVFARSGLLDEGWELVVAGEGVERPALQRRAAELGVAPGTRFVGRVADPDAVRATAALQLATPPGEPFGLSVLEAMAMGLPVLAADGGAHRELLGDRAGCLFTPGDVAEATTKLLALAHDEGLRAEVGRRLQQRQRREFSLAAHGAALEALYADG